MSSVIYLLVILVIILIIFYTQQNNAETIWKRSKIIISGLSSSGKTKLFYKLTRKLNIDAITSFSINEKVYSSEGDNFKIVDIPGHASFERDLINNIEKGTTIFYLMNEENSKMVAESCQRLYNIFITKKFQELGCEIYFYLIKKETQNLSPILLEKELEKEFRRIIFSKKSQEYQGNEDSEQVNDYIKGLDNFKMTDIICRKMKFDFINIENISLNTIFNK